jgi:DhnA family fructose-bisphosphate aldolase class Ia
VVEEVQIFQLEEQDLKKDLLLQVEVVEDIIHHLFLLRVVMEEEQVEALDHLVVLGMVALRTMEELAAQNQFAKMVYLDMEEIILIQIVGFQVEKVVFSEEEQVQLEEEDQDLFSMNHILRLLLILFTFY